MKHAQLTATPATTHADLNGNNEHIITAPYKIKFISSNPVALWTELLANSRAMRIPIANKTTKKIRKRMLFCRLTDVFADANVMLNFQDRLLYKPIEFYLKLEKISNLNAVENLKSQCSIGKFFNL